MYDTCFLKYRIIHMTLVCNWRIIYMLHVVSKCYTFTSLLYFHLEDFLFIFSCYLVVRLAKLLPAMSKLAPLLLIFSQSPSQGLHNGMIALRIVVHTKKLFSPPDLLWCPFSLSLNVYKFHFPSRVNVTTHLHLAAKLRMTNAITA